MLSIPVLSGTISPVLVYSYKNRTDWHLDFVHVDSDVGGPGNGAGDGDHGGDQHSLITNWQCGTEKRKTVPGIVQRPIRCRNLTRTYQIVRIKPYNWQPHILIYPILAPTSTYSEMRTAHSKEARWRPLLTLSQTQSSLHQERLTTPGLQCQHPSRGKKTFKQKIWQYHTQIQCSGRGISKILSWQHRVVPGARPRADHV